MKTYKGNVKITQENVADWEKKLAGVRHITGYLSINAQASLPALKSVGGDLSINAQASLPALKSVGGYLYINAQASLPALKSVGGYLSINAHIDDKLERRLWQHNQKNKWLMTDACSDWLLSRKGKITYRINNMEFPRKMFNDIRFGSLTAEQVFALENMEQRRVAYERLDKIKMRDLTNLTVLLDEIVDSYGHPMRLVSFNVTGFAEAFRYLNCFCPSTGREYYLETRQTTCAAAKSASFGKTKLVFDAEW